MTDRERMAASGAPDYRASEDPAWQPFCDPVTAGRTMSDLNASWRDRLGRALRALRTAGLSLVTTARKDTR